jgi:membrane fusion protein, multidrug efflux system
LQNVFIPGMFVNVQLRLSEQPNAKIVPTQAVTEGPNGRFVYVVKPDQTVEMRPVVSTYAYAGDSVIDSGLKLDEVVVTDGQTRLTPGAKVQITKNLNEDPETDPPASTTQAK